MFIRIDLKKKYDTLGWMVGSSSLASIGALIARCSAMWGLKPPHSQFSLLSDSRLVRPLKAAITSCLFVDRG